MSKNIETKRYMRFTQQEKYEIIRLVDGSDLSANRTLKELGLHKRTYYNWYARYLEDGYDGLASKAKGRLQTWNKIPPHQKSEVVEQALEHPELSSRELAVHIVDHHQWYISESSVYRILKERGLITAPAHIVLSASDDFKDKTRRINEMWQTDFTYFKIIGWGWYYLSTVLDDYSRYIITHDLCENMTSDDVKPSVLKALQVTGLTKNTVLNNLTPADVYYGRAENILQERARIKKATIKSRRKNYYQKNTIRKSIHFKA